MIADAVPAERRRRAALVTISILAAALFIRVAVVLATPGYRPGNPISAESADYHRHAAAIAGGSGYPESWVNLHRRASGVPIPDFVPTAHRLPLFPYSLSVVYRVAGDGPGAWHLARLLQALVGTLIVGLIGLLALHLFGPAAAVVAMVLAALSPALIVYGAGLLSEPAFLVLELGAVLAALAHRRSEHPVRWAALSGALAGLAALTRLNGLTIVVFVVIAVWTGKPRLRWRSMAAPAAALCAAVLVATPWTIRNVRTMDAFLPLSTGTGVGLAGVYNERARTAGCRGCWSFLEGRIYGLVLDPTLDEVELDRRLLRESVAVIREHPLYSAKVTFWNALRFAGWESIEYDRRVVLGSVGDVDGSRAMAVAIWTGTWAFGILAAAGIALGGWRGPPPVLWLLPALFLLTLLPIVSTSRYRLPIDPFVIALGAAGIVALRERLARRSAASPATGESGR